MPIRLRELLMAGVAGAVFIASPALAAPTVIDASPFYTAPVLDGSAQFAAMGYSIEIPNPVQPAFTYNKLDPATLPAPYTNDTVYDWYSISMRQVTQQMGLVDDTTENTLLPASKFWAYGATGAPGGNGLIPYGNTAGASTYPGKTFEIRTGKPVKVIWLNELPLPHILPVDRTMMCGPMLTTADTVNCPDNRGVVHAHGALSFDHSDGLPEQWFSPGFAKVGTEWKPNTEFGPTGTFVYPAAQGSATTWYHDHATGITRLNAYAGLAGFFIQRDQNELNLIQNNVIPHNIIPGDNYETGVAFQDKMVWGVDDPATSYIKLGQIAYPNGAQGNPPVKPSITMEMFGNIILGNGVAWPKMTVEPRQYRVRVINGNDSRTLILKLDIADFASAGPGLPFFIIGSEQGFLPNPVQVTNLVIMPGQRFDLVFDFTGMQVSPDTKVTLFNVGPEGPFDGTFPTDPYDPVYPMADPGSTANLMQFVVSKALIAANKNLPVTVSTPLVATLPAIPAPGTSKPAKRSYFKEVLDERDRVKLTIDNKGLFDAITDVIPLGSKIVWEVANLTPDSHPLHWHLVKFRLVDRQNIGSIKLNGVVQPDPATTPIAILPENDAQVWSWLTAGPALGPQPYEAGWLDTVEMQPMTVTRIQATFDMPGVYVWHCHILSHEEYDMMRQFAVTTAAKGVKLTSSLAGTKVPIGGTPVAVTFTAEAQTGLDKIPLPGDAAINYPATTLAFEYRFWVKTPTGQTYVLKQDWSPSQKLVLSGANAINAVGTWRVKVEARQLGRTLSQAWNEIVLTAVSNVPAGIKLTSPIPPYQTMGKPVQATFTATGLTSTGAAGPGPYEYQFAVMTPGAASFTYPGFQQSNTWNWLPAVDQAPGVYTVKAQVRAQGGSGTIPEKNATYTIYGPKPVGISLTAPSSKQNAATANPVTFTAAALSALPSTAGNGPYEYRFSVKEPDGNWVVKQAWSTTNTWTWTPTKKAGTYLIQAETRQIGTTAGGAVPVNQTPSTTSGAKSVNSYRLL